MNHVSQSSLACPLIAALSFAVLAAGVSLGLTDALDAAARGAINSLASPQFTRVAFGASFLGSTAFLLVLTASAALMLLAKFQRRSALMLIMVFTVAVITNNIVKLTFLRARPEAFFGVLPESYSFASGHALLSACFYGAAAKILTADVCSKWRRAAVWLLACGVIATIGLSRVYLGVHHLTDVLAGLCLGALIVCVATTMFRPPA